MSNEEMATLFDEWNKGEPESFWIEITSMILSKKDDLTPDGYAVDKILDKTGMKGLGRWTVQEAAEQSVAAPTIAALVTCPTARRNVSRLPNSCTDLPTFPKSTVLNSLPTCKPPCILPT
jgi:6-phosphogluconate dehydrogenase